MAALTQLSLSLFDGAAWKAFYKSIGGSSSLKKSKKTLSNAAAAASAYGIDTMLVNQFAIAASGTLSIDLTSYVDIVGQTAQSMARVKAVFAWLFSTEDDPTVTSPASSVSFGAGSTPADLFFGTSATDTFKLKPGEMLSWWTPTATGVAVSGSHKIVLGTNNDGANVAYGRLLIAGSLS